MTQHTVTADAAGAGPLPLREPLAAMVLLLSIAVGVAGGLAALALMFAHVPNELDRMRVLVRAVQHEQPRIAVFGDSRGAAAIDASQLTASLAGRPSAMNLSSHSQTFTDALLLAGRLERGTSVVVLMVEKDRLLSESTLDRSRLAAMRMYGYEPTPQVREEVARSLGAEAAASLDQNVVARIASSRWVVQQAIDMGVYSLARGNAARSRERDDLSLPSAYESPLEASHFEAALRLAIEGLGNARATAIPATTANVLQSIARLTRRHRQRLLVVFYPVHPEVRAAMKSAPVLPLTGLMKDAEVVDLTALVPANEFADPLHVTRAGARRVTAALAARMGTVR